MAAGNQRGRQTSRDGRLSHFSPGASVGCVGRYGQGDVPSSGVPLSTLQLNNPCSEAILHFAGEREGPSGEEAGNESPYGVHSPGSLHQETNQQICAMRQEADKRGLRVLWATMSLFNVGLAVLLLLIQMPLSGARCSWCSGQSRSCLFALRTPSPHFSGGLP